VALGRSACLPGSGARREVSHPTVARRVKALEQAFGARLFDRLPDRFVLTAAGEELLADAQGMEQAAETIHRRSAGLSDTAHGTVRLSAGEAMTAFLARHLPRLRHNMQCIEIELVASHMLANLSRREADLLIRDQVPDMASIVTRKLGRAAYAVYGTAEMVHGKPDRERLGRLPWLGFDDDHSYMPGQRWTHELLSGARPQVRVNNWLVLLEAVRAGAGIAVLPCYLVDNDPALHRIGAPLEEVAVDQWLLVHRDLRNLPRVRAVMDAVIRLFQEERNALEGRCASRKKRAVA